MLRLFRLSKYPNAALVFVNGLLCFYWGLTDLDSAAASGDPSGVFLHPGDLVWLLVSIFLELLSRVGAWVFYSCRRVGILHV